MSSYKRFRIIVTGVFLCSAMWASQTLAQPGGSRSYAFTMPATMIAGTNAVLRGMATPNGLPALAWFEWGTNFAYGNRTIPVDAGSGNSVVFITNQIPGIALGQDYHFRLAVSNSASIVFGADQVFASGKGIWAWGDDSCGQLDVPPGLTDVVAIAAGGMHSLALKSDGTVMAWGDNSHGQTNVPAGLSNVVSIAAGASGNFSVALKIDGTVTAWGEYYFDEIDVPDGLSNVVAIAAGHRNSLALKSDGTLVGWGEDLFGNIGVPDGLSNVVAIAGGTYFDMALKNDGTVVAWGNTFPDQPDVLAGLNRVVAIAAGASHCLALGDDGIVTAWGYDYWGQTDVPAGMSNVVAISGGGFHSVVLQSDGKVMAWGEPFLGQSNVPSELNNVVSIAAGGAHILALTTNVAAITSPPIVECVGNLAEDKSFFRIHSTSSATVSFSIWSSTNLTDWVRLGGATQTGPGNFEFDDRSISNQSRKFYRFQSP